MPDEIPRFFRAPKDHFFLFGPRGTGKSTLLARTFPGALWVDLLKPEIFRQLSSKPERLRAMVEARGDAETVVVDEVQKIPAVLDVVHELIERKDGVRFVLTGSSSRKLKQAGVNLLAGRALLKRLHPFMAAELGAAFDLDQALSTGLVPLVWDTDGDRSEALEAYVALYIREEVLMEGLVRDIGGFGRFTEAISFSHGGVLNLAQVARESEVSRKTVEGYLGVVEDLLLGFRLPVFTRRAKRTLISHPKFYWFDPGVYRALRPVGPLDSSSELAGPGLEGLVAQQLRAWMDLTRGRHSLSYWRTKSGNEVDFVVYGEQGFWAIEVKHSSMVHRKDLRGLRSFIEDYPEAQAILLYRGKQSLRLDGVLCMPVQGFLLGLHPDRALLDPQQPA